MTRDELADLVVDPSPADDHVLTVLGAAEVDGAELAEVGSRLSAVDYWHVDRVA